MHINDQWLSNTLSGQDIQCLTCRQVSHPVCPNCICFDFVWETKKKKKERKKEKENSLVHLFLFLLLFICLFWFCLLLNLSGFVFTRYALFCINFVGVVVFVYLFFSEMVYFCFKEISDLMFCRLIYGIQTQSNYNDKKQHNKIHIFNFKICTKFTKWLFLCTIIFLQQSHRPNSRKKICSSPYNIYTR